MYTVERNGKKTTLTFSTYEQARSMVRRIIRMTFSKDTRIMRDGGIGEMLDNNPAISAYGYRIKRV
jgi:hypothetical protein